MKENVSLNILKPQINILLVIFMLELGNDIFQRLWRRPCFFLLQLEDYTAKSWPRRGIILKGRNFQRRVSSFDRVGFQTGLGVDHC